MKRHLWPSFARFRFHALILPGLETFPGSDADEPNSPQEWTCGLFRESITQNAIHTGRWRWLRKEHTSYFDVLMLLCNKGLLFGALVSPSYRNKASKKNSLQLPWYQFVLAGLQVCCCSTFKITAAFDCTQRFRLVRLSSKTRPLRFRVRSRQVHVLRNGHDVLVMQCRSRIGDASILTVFFLKCACSISLGWTLGLKAQTDTAKSLKKWLPTS